MKKPILVLIAAFPFLSLSAQSFYNGLSVKEVNKVLQKQRAYQSANGAVFYSGDTLRINNDSIATINRFFAVKDAGKNIVVYAQAVVNGSDQSINIDSAMQAGAIVYKAVQHRPAADEPASFASGSYSGSEMRSMLSSRHAYKTDGGFVIRIGDTLRFGEGSMPNKTFAYIYESPVGASKLLFGGSDTKYNGYTNRGNMQPAYAYKHGMVKDFELIGNKRSGFTVVAVISIGGMNRYWVEVESATKAKEIITSNEPSETAAAANVDMSKKLDELKNLKSLLDDGTITQQEFDTQKKKILDQ